MNRTYHLQSMRSALKDWRKQVAARLPEANPDYDPQRATELSKPSKGKNGKE